MTTKAASPHDHEIVGPAATARDGGAVFLSKQRATVQRLIELIPAAVFVVDVEGAGRSFRIFALNRRNQAVTGFSLVDVAGRRLREVLPAESAQRLRARLQSYRKLGVPNRNAAVARAKALGLL